MFVLLSIVFSWIVLWGIVYFWIKNKTSSRIISLGGSFIGSLVLWILVVAIASLVVRKERIKEIANESADLTNHQLTIQEEDGRTSSLALTTIKNLPCVHGGTIDQCFANKTSAPAVQDMGWSTKVSQNGYVVEKTIHVDGLSSPTIYRWEVTDAGEVAAVNGHAIGITRK